RATRAAARSRRSLSADHPGHILRLDVRVWREAWQNATRGVTTAGVLRLEQRVSTSELRRSRISRAQRPAASGRAGLVRLAGEQDRTNGDPLTATVHRIGSSPNRLCGAQSMCWLVHLFP